MLLSCQGGATSRPLEEVSIDSELLHVEGMRLLFAKISVETASNLVVRPSRSSSTAAESSAGASWVLYQTSAEHGQFAGGTSNAASCSPAAFEGDHLR